MEKLGSSELVILVVSARPTVSLTRTGVILGVYANGERGAQIC